LSAGHMAKPVDQLLANYRLNQVINCSWDSYKYHLLMEFSTTHYTYSFPLVKVPVSCRSAVEALSGVESRVESSLQLRKLSRRSVGSCILTFHYNLLIIVLICSVLVLS
jgi:hypothetical protein